MGGFLSQVLLLLAMVTTVLILQPYHSNAASGMEYSSSSWDQSINSSESQTQNNITNGSCGVGLHCIGAAAGDIMEGSLAITLPGGGGNNPLNGNNAGVNCPPNELFTGTSCVDSPQYIGKACPTSNREYPFCNTRR